jgi:hypothetical protein
MQIKAFHPIIYVRGYAMTENEIEDTVADPYMGFNLGSCKLRQVWDGTVKKYFFESPIVRLLKQFHYQDVYEEGLDRIESSRTFETLEHEPRPLPYRSIVIYRYYEPSSEDLGTGQKPDMARFANGLNKLIEDLRDCIYPDGAKTTISKEEREAGKLDYSDFRVHLVAHSMGGLVCRAFLQNPKFGSATTKKLVDKLFTYATPHNGIEVSAIGNVPSWFSLYGMNTFSRDVIASLLGLTKAQRDGDNVDIITNFDADRVFNLVGTNPEDYKVAGGLSSKVVGDASDGLVRIKNATTRGRNKDGTFLQSPQAFVHRSHSGYFGIVNSEEGYQNMARFLFGDFRADGYLLVDDLTLPADVEKERKAGKDVKASYIFETTVSIRGKPWQLHRRIDTENSAIFKKFDDLFERKKKSLPWKPVEEESPMLFTVFLDMSQSQTGKSLAFSVDLCVKVPDYEVDGILFFKNHFEGGYLFRDMLYLEAFPPVQPASRWTVKYSFASNRSAQGDAKFTAREDGSMTFEIPVDQPKDPSLMARLQVTLRAWNR